MEMLHEFVFGEEFFALLVSWDWEIARKVAAEGCRRCGGPLHQGNYQRKPRGAHLAEAGESFTLRFSLCCGREGCRRRTLPPSLRFLGRRVYLEVVVVLAVVWLQLVFSLKATRISTGVPRRTLRRWQTWWAEFFPQLSVWADLQAGFAPPPPDRAALPTSLVARLSAELARAHPGPPEQPPTPGEVMLLVARCLAPATTQSFADGSTFLRAVAMTLASS